MSAFSFGLFRGPTRQRPQPGPCTRLPQSRGKPPQVHIFGRAGYTVRNTVYRNVSGQEYDTTKLCALVQLHSTSSNRQSNVIPALATAQ